MRFKCWLVMSLRWLVVFVVCSLSQAWAGMMIKSDIEAIFADKYVVGEIQPNMPLWPLFVKNPAEPDAKPELVAYVFETVDFEPVRGYGGKPINVLVAMDLQGNFLESKLLDHKEPIFRSEAGFAKLAKFAAQYVGLSTHHNIQIFAHTATTSRDDVYAALHGVQAGTVSAKAIDKTIVLSAASVALAHTEAASAGQIAGAALVGKKTRPQDESYTKLDWEKLVSRGMVSTQTFTRADIEKAFANTKAAGNDKLAETNPNEVALTVHVALVSLPQIGRNLLDDNGWRLLNTNRRQAHALLVTESGPMARMAYESQRIQQDLPFDVRQAGNDLKLRGMSYDKGLKVPGYPESTRAYFFIIENSTPLDASVPFELDLKWGRRFGVYPNQVVFNKFPLTYTFNGWRATLSNVLDTDFSNAEWMKTWISRDLEITVLILGLIVLSIGLLMQKRLSASARRLKIFRTLYLIYTLGFIGWFSQGQLTIVNITASVDELRQGGDLGFFMNDPMTVILWIFVAGTLLVWGRGTFCGWLCPFGALQELISMLTQAVGLRHKRLRTSLDAKLKWIKYLVLVVILGGVWFSPSFAEVAVEIEPFKTAISMYFVRDWPYIAWAVFCIGLSVFVYRGYCRYICPLGAALAATNVLQRWSWIPRRKECGTPCQTCRHRCEYQAIEPEGKVNYSECFQCLDCVSIYQDDQRCLPLIQYRKEGSRLIPIQTGAAS